MQIWSKQNLPPLEAGFYDRPAADVARDLLGKVLVRRSAAGLTSGIIVETEAYLPVDDPASHSSRGKTKSNAAMFAAPGTAYVYPIHAKWCFNTVVEQAGVGSAVLIRALQPLLGQQHMQQRRSRDKVDDLTSGPAKLCQAMEISRDLDGHRLTLGERLWIADSEPLLQSNAELVTTLATTLEATIAVTPRIGISQAKDLPLRFFFVGNRFVSHRGKRWVEQTG